MQWVSLWQHDYVQNSVRPALRSGGKFYMGLVEKLNSPSNGAKIVKNG